MDLYSNIFVTAEFYIPEVHSKVCYLKKIIYRR
jgi:hypothetical protein